jgi:hypothetical protein
MDDLNNETSEIQMTETSTNIDLLGRLRFSVLAAGELLPDVCWNSDGLTSAGQTDLRIIFPRTAVCAAISHAAELARGHHDQRTRASGVFHLFRLPTEMEAGMHRALVDLEQDGYFGDDPSTVMWNELGDIGGSAAEPEEGPVDLGSIDLSTKGGIARLANVYKAAFDAGKSCVPYFTLNR